MRTFGLTSLLLLILLVSGCGKVFVNGSWNGGNQFVSGFVTIVQFTTVDNGSIQVTVVTLANTSGNITQTFCGDQRTQFPLNDFVRATFVPGQPCSTLFNVVITIH